MKDEAERGGDERAGEVSPIFEEGPLSPSPEVIELLEFDDGEAVQGSGDPGRLYDLTTTIGVTLNPRTAQALDAWFSEGPAVSGWREPEPGLDPSTKAFEQIRWVFGVSSLVLFLALVVCGAAGGAGEIGLWLLGGSIVTGGVAAVAHQTAKQHRQDYEEAVKLRNRTARSRMRQVQGTPGPPELKLSLQVAQVAHNIEASPAFSSGYLSGHRRRINLGEEVTQLTSDAVELWKVRQTLTPRDEIADATKSEALLAVLDAHERDLVEVWESLLGRARALDRYLEKVREMNTRLTYLEQLESAADQSGRIASLKVRTIEHEQAAEATDAMTAELTAVREAIDQLVRGLDREAAIFESRPPQLRDGHLDSGEG